MTEAKTPLLVVSNLVKSFSTDESFLSRLAGGSKRIPALNGISLEIGEGEVLGLTGESGSGKSTLGRIIAGLEPPDSGSINFMGKPLNSASEVEVKKARRYLRYIAEENFSGLTNEPKNRLDNLLYAMVDRYPNPDGKAGGRAFALELLKRVGLSEDILERFPTQISGGQRQRYAIARALATRPKLVIADEPVSNLDLTSRTQVLNLMRRLGRDNGTSFLFISHDPSMVRYFADQGRTAVMFAGRIVEVLPTSRLFDQPTHPYTRTLLEVSSAPGPLPGAALNPAQDRAEAQKRLVEAETATVLGTLEGEASDLSLGGNITAAAQLVAANRPGCPYYRWCPERIDLCQTERPKLETVVRRRDPNNGEYVALPEADIDPQHKAACIHYNREQGARSKEQE